MLRKMKPNKCQHLNYKKNNARHVEGLKIVLHVFLWRIPESKVILQTKLNL